MQNLLYEVFFTIAVIQFPKKYILKKKILIWFTIQVIGHGSREATVANWLCDGHSQKRAGHSSASSLLKCKAQPGGWYPLSSGWVFRLVIKTAPRRSSLLRLSGDSRLCGQLTLTITWPKGYLLKDIFQLLIHMSLACFQSSKFLNHT